MKGTEGESRKTWFENLRKRVKEDVTHAGVSLTGSQAGRSSNAQEEERLYKSWKQR